MQLPKSTQQLQLSSNYHACKTLNTSSRRKNHSSHKACLVVWSRYQLENFPSSRKLQRNLKIAVTTVKGQRPTKLLPCAKKTARLCRKLPDKVESIWSMRKTAWYPKTADNGHPDDDIRIAQLLNRLSSLCSSDTQLFSRCALYAALGLGETEPL